MCDDSDWHDIIGRAIKKEASDIHMTVGQRPYMRCQGVLDFIEDAPLTEHFMSEAAAVILDDSQQRILVREREVDLSWSYGSRRFRVHVYYQQGWLAMALRLLPERIPSLAELGMPKAWQAMKELEQGLVLVTGRTGSGKSTTLAAFIEELNQEKAYHIVTLEDPIEYVFQPKRCFISQRELGRDFYAFADALRGSLREMPDVVLVGEIRDYATLSTALMAAAAGMLVLGTLHSASASDAVMRMEGLCPLEERDGLRSLLAEVLRGIFAQRLVPAVNGGRTALVEVLLENAAVRSLIRQGKYGQLSSVMLSQQAQGMQPLHITARKLWQAGKIDSSVLAKVCGERGEQHELSL